MIFLRKLLRPFYQQKFFYIHVYAYIYEQIAHLGKLRFTDDLHKKNLQK